MGSYFGPKNDEMRALSNDVYCTYYRYFIFSWDFNDDDDDDDVVDDDDDDDDAMKIRLSMTYNLSGVLCLSYYKFLWSTA